MKIYIKDVIDEAGKVSGSNVVYLSNQNKIQIEIEGTYQLFTVPSRDFRPGNVKNNFYSQMRRKIQQRIEQVKARQTPN